MLRRQADSRLISGRSRPSLPYRLGRWRWAASAAAAAVALLAFLLPLAAIAARAFTRTITGGLSPANFTLDNLGKVLSADSLVGGALLNSLGYAFMAALLACTAALILAAELDRSRRVMRPVVLALSLGSVAIPGIVLGFGYILLWNRLPGFRDWPFPHYGNASLLVTAYAAAALPYCLIVILAAIGQLSPSLGDAARLQGVGAPARLLRITLPLIFLSAITAFLLAFIRTVFELPLSQLLIPQNGSPIPPLVVRLFNHEGEGVASALSLVAMIVVGAGAGLVRLLANRLLPHLSGPVRGIEQWPAPIVQEVA
jgi:iron(III) transport system permease protein